MSDSIMSRIKDRIKEGQDLGMGRMAVVADSAWLIEKLDRAKELIQRYNAIALGPIPKDVVEFLKEVE